MNFKKSLLCALGMMTAATAIAEPAGRPTSRDVAAGPDFVLEIPLKLEKIPGEVHTVVVWCDILNASYGWVKSGNRNPHDPKLLRYNGEPKVIAQTGSVEIPVWGRSPADFASGRAEEGLKWPPGSWDLKSVWSDERVAMRVGPAARTIIPTRFVIETEENQLPLPPYFATNRRGETRVTLHASAKGSTDPALGTAYACFMGFKARGLIEGRMQDFTVFAPDASTYTAMPFKGDPKVKNDEATNKILTVIGNIGNPAQPSKR